MDTNQFVENHIPVMNTPAKVYELFKGLGYKTLDTSYRGGKEAYGLREKDADYVKDIYTICNYEKKFQVFLVECKLNTSINTVVKTLPPFFEREIQYPFFIITTDYKNYTFAFIEKIREDVGAWKRKIVRLNLDRDNAYYTDKETLVNIAVSDGKDSPSQLYRNLKESFSIDRVTKLFFEDYKNIFFKIRSFLQNQNINVKQAHEFSQQLLNRIMFIYFVDKRRWLKHSPKFMQWFWNRYSSTRSYALRGNALPNFYEHWLKILFLESFNNKFSHPNYLPQDVKDALQLAPYLNGGLFKSNELDYLPTAIPDEFMEGILAFFNKYNFTIKEDLPLDVEVAVDPQMIGYVYESLASVAEEIYERQDLGIFYTPKVEVDFMCRRTLLEYLAKSTDIPKETLYRLLFTRVEKSLKLKDYEKLEDALDNLSVLDPACGSGAFLVGMLSVLVEIYKFIYKNLRREMSDYELKKRIIGNTLYGIDIMPWAVHSAELRLWLSLMIESDLTLSNLKLYPLLPNLNLKLRVGDSLVQEIAGANLNIRDETSISASLKKKLANIKQEKEKYFNGEPTAKFKTAETVLDEELKIFNDILQEKIEKLEKEKRNLTVEKKEQTQLFEQNIVGAGPAPAQNQTVGVTLAVTQNQNIGSPLAVTQNCRSTPCGYPNDRAGARPAPTISRSYATNSHSRSYANPPSRSYALRGNADTQIEILEKQKQAIDEEINKLKKIKTTLKENKPFIWDIDFAEIFGEKGGFDIVIGNPPYVRQEKIAPPNKLKSEITNEQKREYKEKLLQSVQAYFPNVKSIDKKSDYYVYFYFHGLSLLNEKGTFCFITSNSWLDVGYGKDLQEFLLRYVPIIAIYDNQKARSFEHADVNTIIALFGAPVKPAPTNDQNDTITYTQNRRGNPCGYPNDRAGARPAPTNFAKKGQPQGLPLQNLAKFVMFKKPFEEVINLENLLKIENYPIVSYQSQNTVGAGSKPAQSNVPAHLTPALTTDDFRVYPKKQIALLEEGWEYPEKEIATPSACNDKPLPVIARDEVPKQSHSLFKDKFLIGKYTGNKWGGKYLRAPDIFFTILEKGNKYKFFEYNDESLIVEDITEKIIED